VKAPLEIALNYPVEVGGIVHDKLVAHSKVRLFGEISVRVLSTGAASTLGSLCYLRPSGS